ncbi:EAL domain-containing protein (putative c-di-GMP-specific phosphodiesterase class I) [Sphingobium sp. B2D3B]|uniref:EAL domain-containing protein n=1 Tax=Sphingobium sp. B2D3B TaxID=2940580 RepID=UPI0022246E94|nr:EAL domain-containing protein [Sphingobium sp. B2D3B]MCW2382940.1 EAL domain-containing protein (putative c-di-GMP-specific phosphodiesterase class I) [Sphingobium sp. B2D3B]
MADDFGVPVNLSVGPAPELVMVGFRIDNLSHLAQAYGEAVREGARALLAALLGEVLGGDGVVMPVCDDLITAVVWSPTAFGQAFTNAACADFARRFAVAVAGRPLLHANADLRLAVSAAWSLLPDVHSDADLGAARDDLACRLTTQRFNGNPIDTQADWAQRYRADMAQAASLLSALANGRLLPVWQPVRNGAQGDAVLYHECLLRMLEDGRQETAGPAIDALERLGMVGVLDHYVVSTVIEELQRDPDVCLGANISAHSACPGGWWDELMPRLRDMPSVARRLVIEITETAHYPDIGEATCFAARLRKLGVRVALDDFGVGHASLRSLLALQPDIIKIDAFFLRRAIGSEPDRVALHHLIGLAGSFVADVVVEGVETEEEFDLAREAGAIWLQGYHMGRPSVVRPWFKDAVQTNVLALFEKRQAYREAGWSVPG